MYFRKFTEYDIDLLRSWRKDHLVQKYVHYASLEDWFNYVNENPNYYSWIAYERELPDVAVGIVNVEEYKPLVGAISVITNPVLRGKGYGAKIVKYVIQQPEIAHLKKIEAFIKPENVPSLKCFQKANFINHGLNDGLFEYVFEK